jgi:NitT/TauT family transport system permease protein
MTSWFLDWLRSSRLLALARGLLGRWRRLREGRAAAAEAPRPPRRPFPRWAAGLGLAAFVALLAGLGYGAWRLLLLILAVSAAEWKEIAGSAGATLGRVLLSTALGTVWALPAGLAIGLSPRLSRALQPVVQVLASFPVPLLFPLFFAGFELAGVSLGWGSILLMLLGTQWYILFNVIAGAMAIPADLREAARSYRITGWQRFRTLYLPAVFPYLVTGWVTAAGGAWNASIVAEYGTYRGQVIQAWGLGALISRATERGNIPLLAASALVMAALVVAFNHAVWRRLYRLAEDRYSLTK